MSATVVQPTIGTIFDEDSPRVRKSDPVTSHIAGDASKASMHETKLRVLHLIADLGPLVGSEVNDHYRDRAWRRGWERRAAYDTPRKRAGELASDGYLEVTDTRTGGNGLPESIYGLTDKGRRVVALGLGS
jgi:hypothetical protein